jgi:hypothetical protein
VNRHSNLATRFTAAAAFILLSAQAAGGKPGPAFYPGHAAVIQAARNRDVEFLKRIKPAVKKRGIQNEWITWGIAFYMADPETAAEPFLSVFPENRDGVRFVLDSLELGLAHLMPRFLYSFESLGGMACRGSRKAIEKLFRIGPVADGLVLQSIGPYLASALAGFPVDAVAVLHEMSAEHRKAVYRAIGFENDDAARDLSRSLPDLRKRFPRETFEIETLLKEADSKSSDKPKLKRKKFYAGLFWELR